MPFVAYQKTLKGKKTGIYLFELGRQSRPGRHTGIRLCRPVPAEGQNKSLEHRLTDKAITYQEILQNNSLCLTQWCFCILLLLPKVTFVWDPLKVRP
jgi:hypothetical protein